MYNILTYCWYVCQDIFFPTRTCFTIVDMSTIFLYDEFISQPEVNLHVIGKQISILFRQLNLYFNRELSDIHISSTELLYLSSLYANDGIPQDDLAQEYTVDKAAVTRTIQLMEKKGLVLRRTDASDKRAKKIYLTEKARSLEPKLRELQARWISAMTEGMNTSEIVHFTKLVHTMAERAKQLNQKEIGGET
ncbi:hypothetical protein C808_03381 [Lachnospiraceae bacterium M18-1]|nr:hypothetical protein C808_03381 [Lachnospiraceae bacterium M18-1]